MNGRACSQTIMRSRLLVFAHADEAQAFVDVPHFVSGIGKISATVNLGERLSQGDVSEVVVLGTAGMLDDGLDFDAVHRIGYVMQHDFEFPSDVVRIEQDGSVSLIDPLTWEAGTPEISTGEAVIATGDVFVKDDLLRASLIAQGAQLVDMESYAFAVLCRVYEVPLTIYKIPSDTADSATTNQSWDDIVAVKSRQLREFAQAQGLL